MIVAFEATSSRHRSLAAPPSARRRSSTPGKAEGSNGSGSIVGLWRTRLGLVIAYLGLTGWDECIAGSVQSAAYAPGVCPLIDPLVGLVIIAAGVAAGAINAIVGAGSLVTFPTLLLLGYPPLVANVSNTVGLVPGTLSGTVGYRRELAGQRARARPLLAAAGLGGLSGACLLLVLPASAFASIVPILILVACGLVVVQPRLSAWVLERRARSGTVHAGGGPLLLVGVYLTGIYGGYFGAAQGVILIALLAILVEDDLQRLNGLKNLIATVINGVAALIFIAFAPVAWVPAILLAIGSTIGGQLGAFVGRRFSPLVLRGAIVLIGTIVAVRLWMG
jgi:hypothetical protein